MKITKYLTLLLVLLLLIGCNNSDSSNNERDEETSEVSAEENNDESNIEIPNKFSGNFYNGALWAFHELNEDYENGDFPNEELTGAIVDKTRDMESNPNDYSDREKYVIDSLTKLLLGIGDGLEEQIRISKSNLSMALEVEEDYLLRNKN